MQNSADFSSRRSDESVENNSEDVKEKHNHEEKPKIRSHGSTRNTRPQFCAFYSRYGWCKYGYNCKFTHDRFRNNSHRSPNYRRDESWRPSASNLNRNVNRGYALCRHFKAGNCSWGENCRFVHLGDVFHNECNTETASQQSIDSNEHFHTDAPVDIITEKLEQLEMNSNVPQQEEISHKSTEAGLLESEHKTSEAARLKLVETARKDYKQRRPVINMKNIYDLNNLSTDNQVALRNTEIEQLKKRFPNYKGFDENVFSCCFQPTDPDWAFDVKELQLDASFPEMYPLVACKIKVVSNNDMLPSILVNCLNKSIADWLEKCHLESTACGKVELVFRPFLKWFDRNLEDLFIEGLRKVKQDIQAREAGIEFVAVENLFPSTSNNTESKERETQDELLLSKNEQEPKAPEMCSETKKCDKNSTSSGNSTSTSFSKVSLSHNNSTKILFLSLELSEAAAVMKCIKLTSMIQCSRCKTRCEVMSSSKKETIRNCSKCFKTMSLSFQPSILHQFSNIVGYLFLSECQIVDVNLIECGFMVDCLHCSKQINVDGLHYGQKFSTWCMFCNQKMAILIGGVKFQSSKSTSVTTAKALPSKKPKKDKDLAIREGEPLPDNGTCKHYKKSYRWLRFPCCGRIYPCDICHDEKEKDHEMKFASRMICGFCSKEQPYSRDKQCISCSSNVTKKSGAHWEGGKGCRNKIQMSREDKHKYVGVSKTVSKKAQGVKTGKK